jgi:DNA-binding LacI/PurR family transcriptional regulator
MKHSLFNGTILRILIVSSSRPKLQDVADLAGVSIGTASQALNNKALVSPETRELVIQAANQLGYELPSRVLSQSDKEISTVGVLVKIHAGQSGPIDPFYSAILSGAEQECKRHNLNLLYSSLPVDDLSMAVEWPHLVNDQQPNGWLILGAFVQETIFELEQHLTCPVVLVDTYAHDSSYDVIVTDNVTGAYDAVTYLVKQGHHHIGLIGSAPESHPSVQQRREGYLRALADYGIEYTYLEDSSLHSDAASFATQNLLKRAPEITAIFACNDDVAMAVMRAAHDLGRRIPDDLSVMGFGDTDPASEIIPPLTTMFVDKTLMGALGVRQLLDRKQNPTRVPLTIVLGTRLVERKSVQKVK